MACDSLDGKEVWGRMDAHTHTHTHTQGRSHAVHLTLLQPC